MFFRRVLIPIVLLLTLLVQFVPGTAFSPRPVAADSCDMAQFVADVTIPDGTTLAPGATFAKTWRLKNIGSCTWTTSYAVVFTGGVGENSPQVRRMAVDGLQFLGLDVDSALNETGSGDRDVSLAGAAAKTLVVSSREDVEIAREVRRLLDPAHGVEVPRCRADS